jgi:hypothetical protein
MLPLLVKDALKKDIGEILYEIERKKVDRKEFQDLLNSKLDRDIFFDNKTYL